MAKELYFCSNCHRLAFRVFDDGEHCTIMQAPKWDTILKCAQESCNISFKCPWCKTNVVLLEGPGSANESKPTVSLNKLGKLVSDLGPVAANISETIKIANDSTWKAHNQYCNLNPLWCDGDYPSEYAVDSVLQEADKLINDVPREDTYTRSLLSMINTDIETLRKKVKVG